MIALRIVRSPVGAVLSAIRENPLRAAAVGHNVHGYKLTAFVIAAAYAGFAGGLLGVLQAFMPPDAFMFETSGQLVMQTAIGGRGTLFGPLVGAAVWLFLQDFLQAHARPRRAPGSWCWAWCSCCWSASCARASSAASRDLWRAARGASRRPPSRAPEEAPRRSAPPAAPMPARASRATRLTPGPILQATGLTKRYGGVVANERHRLHRQRRRAARHHRPERRGQDAPSSRC